MKKFLVVLGVAAFGFAFTSCEKTCECTTYALGVEKLTASYPLKSGEDCAKWITVAYDDITQSGIKCVKK